MVQISMKSEEGTEKADYDEPCGIGVYCACCIALVLSCAVWWWSLCAHCLENPKELCSVAACISLEGTKEPTLLTYTYLL